MRYFTVLTAGLLLASLRLGAATTPMETPLPDEQTVTIECEYKPQKGDEAIVAYAGTGEDPKKAKEAVFHYNVYIPKGYGENKERRFPCMFIASSTGNADMAQMRERLTHDRWLVVMLAESKNDSPEWLRNFVAAHDDAVSRLRILEDMKFGAGLAGGARCCSVWPEARKGFRGLFMQAAGFAGAAQAKDVPKQNPSLLFYATFGATDGNLHDTANFRSLPPTTARYITVFEGGSEWAPAKVASQAFDWFEKKIFLESRTDPKLKDAYLWYVENLITRLDADKTPLEQFELCEHLQMAAKQHGLASQENIKTKLEACKDQLAKLEKDEALRKELVARKAYQALEASEDTPLNAVVKPKGMSLSVLSTEYTKLAKIYTGTVYGSKAEQRATSINAEIGKKK
jgi:hypothetical protein